jgi:adenylosuccinate lyase
VHGTLEEMMAPENFVGRAPEQVEEFLEEVVEPALAEYGDLEGGAGKLRV